jgi:hypothetical protein
LKIGEKMPKGKKKSKSVVKDSSGSDYDENTQLALLSLGSDYHGCVCEEALLITFKSLFGPEKADDMYNFMKNQGFFTCIDESKKQLILTNRGWNAYATVSA